MRNKVAIMLLFGLILQAPLVWASVIPQDVSIYVQSDGVSSVAILFPAMATSTQTNITLIGDSNENLFIINEDGLPLEYTESSEGYTVYSLGSSLVNLTYMTAELTGKSSIVWTLSFSSPISTEILLPTGATIINLNNIPLEIDTVDDRTQLIMPSGNIEVSYTISIIDSETLAGSAISVAEAEITEAQSDGILVDEAEMLLAEAVTLFQQENYLDAEEKASQAIQSVNSQISAKLVADSKLATAESAIDAARDAGRTSGLSDAETLLVQAYHTYELGDYIGASALADDAVDAAFNAIPSTNYTLIIAVVTILVGGGYYLYSQRKPGEKQAPDHIDFDLERLFDEHPELRVDDKEVLRYLAENDGEAFAYDIRERFDIPRTSAWRMVQRLQRFEVVDERKVGGQSLVSIKTEYRRSS